MISSGPVMPPVGVAFGSLTPPELLAGGAALAERLGFADLWFSEDWFFTGAMSGMTQLLASTESVPVRLGLASNLTRHPALLAMELAGLARMYPGRISATLGLGNTHWLDQLGLRNARPLSTLLADFGHLRDLLEGRAVSSTDGHVFDDIRLEFPPDRVPPLWLGAVNGRALRAAGATADGVLLSVISGPRYVRWAVDQVRAGAAEAGRSTPPPVVAFALTSVDPDPARAHANVRDAVAFFARAEAHTSLLTRSSFTEADVAALEAGDPDRTEAMINELAAAGTPGQVTDRLNALFAAGADAIGLWPFPSDRLTEQLTMIAEQVLPGVRHCPDGS